jgi:hypothetical protein
LMAAPFEAGDLHKRNRKPVAISLLRSKIPRPGIDLSDPPLPFAPD